MALLSPRLPLSFLLELHPRDTNRKGAPPGVNDSAIFFRLWELFNTLGESEVQELLTVEQKEAASAFTKIFNEMPWRELPEYPHFKEIIDDDLSPLMKPGRRLYDALSAT